MGLNQEEKPIRFALIFKGHAIGKARTECDLLMIECLQLTNH
jgi:hypothetical protein